MICCCPLLDRPGLRLTQIDPSQMTKADLWSFEKAKLSPSIVETITRLGFTKPTPVQNATIPLFLNHKDVVVEAITGSGKTLAFAIPILEMLLNRKPKLNPNQVGAIVISPTRELAIQTRDVLTEFAPETMGIRVLTMIGGTEVSGDVAKAKQEGANIIVATPGRLLDMFEKHSELFDLKSLEVLVLDEADRLLNLGFSTTINSIIERLPKQRRTGLFSATMSDALSELIRTGLRNPVRVTVKVESKRGGHEQKTPELLKSFYALCEYESRLPFILNYLQHHPTAKKTIVYFATCASVDYFSRVVPLLPECNNAVGKIFSLHGKMEAKKRTKIHQEFQSLTTEKAILFCTDLAARGLDFADVDLVIQYEAPQDPATFVHRCGRTARIGRVGEALVLLSEQEDAYVEFLSNRKVPLKELPAAPAPQPNSFFDQLRTLNASDRDLLERSTKAFVAFIRFYQEHQAKFIFRLKDISVVEVAKSFGLLRMPKMKELNGISTDGFVPSDIDPSTITFKDPNRNKQRADSFKALKNLKQKQKNSKSTPDAAISSAVQRKKEQDEFKESRKTNTNKVNMEELDEDWKAYKKAKKNAQSH